LFFGSTFFKGCFLAQPFLKVVFWLNLFLKGCFLAQPFVKVVG